jgi:DHA2 family multidrug resistance protein
VVTGIVQGLGIGLVFVALSTVTFATLPAELRTSGAAITTLIRNLGAAIGISTAIAVLTSKTNEMHARLAEHITPFNDALRAAGAPIDPSTDQGRMLLDQLITQQATVIAYQNDFMMLFVFALATMPFVLLIGGAKTKQPAGGKPAVAEA